MPRASALECGSRWMAGKRGCSQVSGSWTELLRTNSLSIDGTNPKRLLYAAVDDDGRLGQVFGGLWVSVDGAANWQHVELPECHSPSLNEVVFAAGKPLVSTRCGIATTADPTLLTGPGPFFPRCLSKADRSWHRATPPPARRCSLVRVRLCTDRSISEPPRVGIRALTLMVLALGSPSHLSLSGAKCRARDSPQHRGTGSIADSRIPPTPKIKRWLYNKIWALASLSYQLVQEFQLFSRRPARARSPRQRSPPSGTTFLPRIAAPSS